MLNSKTEKVVWTILVCVWLGIYSSVSLALPPDSINYQGYLTDDQGLPVTADVDISFSLYLSEAASSSEWSEVQTVSVSKGLFNVELGTVTPLPLNLLDVSNPFHLPLFLGVTVGADPEMLPRKPLTLTSYAIKAYDADSVGGLTSGAIDSHLTDLGDPHDIVVSEVEGAVSTVDLQTHTDNTNAHHTPVTNFSELSGEVTVSQIQDDAITSSKILDGEVTSADVGFDYAGSLSKGGPASDVACVDCISQSELDFTPGDITSVIAGTGLNGGGTVNGVTLNVDVPLELTGKAINGIIRGTESNSGNYGYLGSTNYGVYGNSPTSAGVGVYGRGFSYGVEGVSTSDASIGVMGWAQSLTGGTVGVKGFSDSEDYGIGVEGVATATSGLTMGVRGANASTQGAGVAGFANSDTGIYVWGVYGVSESNAGSGVYGLASADNGATSGVRGESRSNSGTGVLGLVNSATGITFGVSGTSESSAGRGVYGYTDSSSGVTYGIYGKSDSTSGRAVFGDAAATTGDNLGVYGISRSTSGIGVRGNADASSGDTIGVLGSVQSDAGYAVYGNSSSTTGENYGVYGRNASPDGFAVYGVNALNNNYGYIGSRYDGVVGITQTGVGYALYGKALGLATTAGRFEGNVSITGTLSKGGGSFKIDHPLDPENKYLSHSFVESPDMMNVYNGNIILNDDGNAVVELPEWFDALNKEFRYQLTCIGGFAQVYIAEEINNNQFSIAGGTPGLKVSWQVTGVRKDPFAEKNRIRVEENKTASERGFYLYPDLYEQSEEKGIEWGRSPELMVQIKEQHKIKHKMHFDDQ